MQIENPISFSGGHQRSPVFPRQQISDASKLNGFADDNFNFDEIGRVLHICRNTVGKGEIACYKQFLLFPQCFQKTCTADT